MESNRKTQIHVQVSFSQLHSKSIVQFPTSPKFSQIGSEKHCTWKICILTSNNGDYYIVETNIKHYLKCRVKSKSFSLPFIFFFAMTSEAFIVLPAQTILFLKSVCLIVEGITHKAIVVCSNLPFQPFLLSFSLWYLIQKPHRTTHCFPNALSLPHLFAIAYPIACQFPLLTSFLLTSHHLSTCGPNLLSFAHCLCC